MLFSRARGKMIHEKNLKQKILWHFPIKVFLDNISEEISVFQCYHTVLPTPGKP